MLTLRLLLPLLGATLAFPDPKVKVSPQTPLVTTPLGQIQGATLTSRLGKHIYAFRGIRYAKAPVEDLRFQPPVPVDKWDGIYNATEDGPVCPQPTTDTVSEDCLLLNVYTNKLPKANDAPKRPVIVYLHAGGFYSLTGASPWAGPQYLLDQEVVLVTINYRLGTLGFLSTGDKEAPGNNGLKDQVQALKWVKQNIAMFGGDPDSVTLMGYSSGAASVTLHLVSPMSQGLFHKAIIMSGSSFGNHPVPHNQLDIAKKQASFLECPDDTSANIIKCLKSKSANELGESLGKFAEFGQDPVLIWLPVVEEDFKQDRFLPAHPVYLLQNGEHAKVPVLIGVTSDEFAGRAFDVVRNSSLAEEMDKEWERVAPIAFIYERDTDNSKAISKSLRETYLSDKGIDNSTLPQLGELYSDAITGFGVNRAAKLLSEKENTVYYYKFSYKGRFSYFYLPDSNGTIPFGVVHHDDLIYLMHISKLFPQFKEGDPESDIVTKMTLLWSNFAKTGNPIPTPLDELDNVKWDAFNTKTQKYMDIGNKLVIGEKLFEKRYSEWEKLFPLSQVMKKKPSG